MFDSFDGVYCTNCSSLAHYYYFSALSLVFVIRCYEIKVLDKRYCREKYSFVRNCVILQSSLKTHGY